MRETPTHASQSSPADVPPAVWQALAERYEHRRFLGSGGMGVVYLAHDRVLDRDVALKFPQPAYVADDILRQRFQREARVTARLELEGVCPIYDSGVAAGFSYIAMRFIEGMGLDEWIRSHRLSERGVLSLIRRLALVMDDVHRRGIVHRDLKPGNILIDRNTQRPVIADFGCSKYLDQGTSGEDKHAAPLTSSNQLIGTVPYMPLEAFEGADITASTQWDIYSLGAIFYELITGERPLGNQFHEVVNRHVKGPPPVPVAQIRDDVDPRTSAICMKMLSQEPQDRHASMGEIATEIEGVLSSLKATATIPETTSELPQRRSTRRDATVGIIGVVLAALFVLIRGAEHLPDPDTSVKSVEQSLVSLPPSQQESIPELPVKYGASGAASAPLPSRRYFLGVAISQFSTDDYSGFPEAEQEMQDLSDALETRDFQTIALLSGSDAGRDMIISALGSLRETPRSRETRSLLPCHRITASIREGRVESMPPATTRPRVPPNRSWARHWGWIALLMNSANSRGAESFSWRMLQWESALRSTWNKSIGNESLRFTPMSARNCACYRSYARGTSARIRPLPQCGSSRAGSIRNIRGVPPRYWLRSVPIRTSGPVGSSSPTRVHQTYRVTSS